MRITTLILLSILFIIGCKGVYTPEDDGLIIKSQSGCMLPDAPNYNASALLACTTDCIDGQTGENCCCEEIIYGCLDTSANNYNPNANAPCTEYVADVETPNACCNY